MGTVHRDQHSIGLRGRTLSQSPARPVSMCTVVEAGAGVLDTSIEVYLSSLPVYCGRLDEHNHCHTSKFQMNVIY